MCVSRLAARDAKKDDLFVGDTLFAGSIGRTDLPGGDHPTLIRSITQVLFAFGDAARVYSGHGPADDDRAGAANESVPEARLTTAKAD